VRYQLAPSEPTYSIDELANQLGVSRRKIYFWRKQRLIDPPFPRCGPNARYTERHVAQAREVQRIKDERFVLSQIGRHLAEENIDILRYRDMVRSGA
jgi:DNA-binding transcriptional MerR regulator